VEYKKVQRQVQMMMLLSENPKGLTIYSLHKLLRRNGFDMDVRTVRRDITDLLPIFNIQTSGDMREPVYHAPGIRFGSISFRFEDMQAFQLLQELAKPYFHLDIGRRMARFLEQLKDAIPPLQQEWLKKASSIISINQVNLQEERDISVEMRQTLETGISDHVCVHLRYFAFSNNSISERDVEPLRIEFSEGCYHLWAFCHEKQAIRDFRLSRIEKVSITEIRFEPRLDLLKTAFLNRFEYMSSAVSEKVVIKFKGFSGRYVQEYYRTKSDSIICLDDGNVLFEMDTSITDELTRWVLGFGAGAEVLEPAAFREKVKKQIYEMMAPYLK